MNKSRFSSPKIISFIFLIFIFLFTYLSTTEAQSQTYLNRVAKFGGPGVGYEISIQNNFAYIAENDGFVIVDIENPLKPTQVGEFLNSYGVFGIFIKNDLAFLASGGYGLEIANISDPTSPFFVGDCAIDGVSSGVYATNNYAYIASYDTGFQVIDISNLSYPVKVGEYTAFGRADSVIVVDDIAYVAFTSHGLVVLNITIPTSPTYISTVSYSDGATGLTLHQNLLFVSCYSSSVLVLDISTPNIPVILGVHSDNDEGEAQGVTGNSTHLYIADYYGIEYLDISELPTITEKAENRERLSSVHDIDFVENYLFLAGGGVGKACIVYEVSNTQKINYLGIYIGVPIAIVTLTSLVLIYRLKIRRKKV